MPIEVEVEREPSEIRCPTCGSEMERGFVATRSMALRWTKKKHPKMAFTGEPLLTAFRFWSMPTYEALRCQDCLLVVFGYGDDTIPGERSNHTLNPADRT